jgi:hypothetical protein
VFPDHVILERSSMNSWDDQKVRDALAANGRKKIIVAGLWTEVCNTTFALSAMLEGDYEIYMVADASGGTSKDAHDFAMQRMVQAGVVPMTWQQVLLEWQRDWAHRDTYDAVMKIVTEHSGAYGMGVDYAYTMVHKAPARNQGHNEVLAPVLPRFAERIAITSRKNGSHHASTVHPAKSPTLILINGKFATLDRERPQASAVAIRTAASWPSASVDDVMRHREAGSQVIDLNGRTVIPGLNDSHLHLIRGGLNYNLELRWEGVPSLADALRMLKEQADRTPHPQWVRVVGGWSEFQFAERRMPTLEEINAAAPDTPVFILHLYDRALLNRAALRAVGYTKDTPNPPGGEIQRDAAGNPTGMLIARPNAMILYATLAKGPTLPYDLQVNSTRQFMRELNRLGITSAIDAGGGFQNYPDDYAVIEELDRNKQLTIRIAYNLFTQNKGQELEDFQRWTGMVKPGEGSDYYRHNGAGEMLVFSAADFEDFLEPRPELAAGMETNWKRWCATWWSSAGPSACMRPTTNRSRACSTCSKRSTARFPSTACTGCSTIARPSASAISSA